MRAWNLPSYCLSLWYTHSVYFPASLSASNWDKLVAPAVCTAHLHGVSVPWAIIFLCVLSILIPCKLLGIRGEALYCFGLQLVYVHAKSLQSCPTLCDPMDYSSPGSSVEEGFSWGSPCKNSGVGCHVLLPGIFPTQGLSPCLLGLLHCWWVLYH